MLEVSCEILKPGMRLAKPVYNANGLLLMKDGETIYTQNIDQLRTYEVEKIYIQWPNFESMEVVSVIKNETRQKAIQFVSESLSNTYHSQILEIDRIRKQVETILHEILDHDDMLLNLTNLRAIDDYTFGHSVNVCVLSLILGMTKGMSQDSLRELGIGAIVHDIGKLFVNQNALNKPGVLEPDEYEEMKKHATLGAALIRNIEELPENVLDIILYHHEWYNGAGYPNGLAGEEIPIMARIVAICDVYDALTSDRVYKKKISPQQALEYLVCMGDRQFDFGLLKQFIRHIRIYSSGMMVRLSTGEEASVLANNPSWPTRPVVQITADSAGRPVEEYQILDLSKKLSVEIL